MTSFLAQGHGFDLYTYGEVRGVPSGAVVRDANAVVPSFEIERFKNLANFSDYFRYMLLHKFGGWWVDLDNFCLKPYRFDVPYVFSTQFPGPGGSDEINSGVIKVPVGSSVIRHCLERLFTINTRACSWSEIGPALLLESVFRHNLQNYAKSSKTFCPVNFFEAPECVNARGTENFKFPDETSSVHLWNEEWRRAGADKNGRWPGSLYERLLTVGAV